MTFHDRKNKMPAQSFAFSPNILLAQPFENRRYIQRITSISNRFSCCTSTAALIDFLEIMIWAILESVTYPHQIIHMTLIPADSFLPILSNFRNITVKDSTKLGKFCLEHGGHQEKTTGTKKQQIQKKVQQKQQVQKSNRYEKTTAGTKKNKQQVQTSDQELG